MLSGRAAVVVSFLQASAQSSVGTPFWLAGLHCDIETPALAALSKVLMQRHGTIHACMRCLLRLRTPDTAAHLVFLTALVNSGQDSAGHAPPPLRSSSHLYKGLGNIVPGGRWCICIGARG